MSDRLDKLPLKEDANLTDDEKETITKMFGDGEEKPKKRNISTLKLIGYTTLLFLALANPFIDVVLEKVPYCEGTIGLLALKSLLFAILFFIVYRYIV